MAIRYPLVLPDFIPGPWDTNPQSFMDSSIGIAFRQIANRSMDGTLHVHEQPGSRWRGSFTLPPMDAEQFAPWRDFLLKLQGMSGTFRIGDDAYHGRPKSIVLNSIDTKGRMTCSIFPSWERLFTGDRSNNILTSYGQWPQGSGAYPHISGRLSSRSFQAREDIMLRLELFSPTDQNDIIIARESESGQPTVFNRFDQTTYNQDRYEPIDVVVERGHNLQFIIEQGNDVDVNWNNATNMRLGIGIDNSSSTYDQGSQRNHYHQFQNGRRIEITSGTVGAYSLSWRNILQPSDWVKRFDFGGEFHFYIKTNDATEFRVYSSKTLPDEINSTPFDLDKTVFTTETIQSDGQRTLYVAPLEANSYYDFVMRKLDNGTYKIFLYPSTGWQNTEQRIDVSILRGSTYHLIQRFYLEISRWLRSDHVFDLPIFLSEFTDMQKNQDPITTESDTAIQTGDYFNLGDTLHQAVAVEDQGDTFVVDFVPKLDVIPSSLPPLNWENPTLIARLADQNLDFAQDSALRYKQKVQWEEA